jgi:hypothetical protein
MSPMPTPNSIYHMPWSPAEKKIARRAFDAALERQCAVILGDLKSMVASASAPEDLWKMHDFLTEQRREISQVYDYRYSMLIVVFARLLGEGWLKEADLEGLREDKLEHIRDMATSW